MIRSFLVFIFIVGLASPGHGKSLSDAAIWNSIHSKALEGSVKTALSLVKTLEKRQSSEIQKDELSLLKGRLLYQAKQYAKAIVSYTKIPKNSEFWLASLEERAWAKIRLGLFNEAIADSKTMMSPLFSDIIGPESYFVSTYISHRVCDFKSVFEITDVFKKKNKLRILHLEKMARMEKTRGVADFISVLKKKGLEASLNPQIVSFFPSHFYRDREFKSSIKKIKGHRFNAIGLRRILARLAKEELKHYADVIGKLHLLEGDSIQRIYMDQSLKGQRSQVGNGITAGDYDLQFPYEAKDVWVDEIDSLKVSAKNCPQLTDKGVQI